MAAKILHTAIGMAIVVATALSCSSPAPEQPQAPAIPTEPSTFSVKGSVREMNIVPETVEFPDHPGKDEFVMSCGVCHSLRYISMQPNFPKKTWVSEVKKMIEKYGAPIDSVTGQKITDYLVVLKGIPE